MRYTDSAEAKDACERREGKEAQTLDQSEKKGGKKGPNHEQQTSERPETEKNGVNHKLMRGGKDRKSTDTNGRLWKPSEDFPPVVRSTRNTWGGRDARKGSKKKDQD